MHDHEIIIKVTPHTEGGLNYDIFLDRDDDDVAEGNSDDGGICTSGCHTAECKNDYCEGCPEAMDKPYNREDWANAFDMARDQALELLFPAKVGLTVDNVDEAIKNIIK